MQPTSDFSFIQLSNSRASKVLLLKDGKLIKSSTSYELIESIENKMFEKRLKRKN